MSDLRISELPPLLAADAEATDDLAVADYSASETKRLSISGAVEAGLRTLPDGAISGAKLVTDSVTTAQLAPNAVTAVELADNAVDTAAIQDLAVTDAKLASGINGAKLLADSVTTTQIAPGAVTGTELAAGAVTTGSFADGAVTNAKLAAGIDGAKLTDGSVSSLKLAGDITGSLLLAGTVTARELADKAVTTAKLGDRSVGSAALQDGAVTTAKLADGIDGDKLGDATVPIAKLAAGSVDRGLDLTSGAIGHTNIISAGSRNGVTYDAQGHITGTAAIGAADLPVATTTTAGAVSVPAASGLSVSGLGAIAHASSITAGSRNGITYNASGHITAAAALTASDLPLATTGTAGAAYFPGVDILVAADGAVSHANSGVTPGTYTRVTVGSTGHITAGGALLEADIPGLSASKLVSGTIDAARIADGTITREKLAAFSVGFIQEGTPPTTGVEPSTLWLQESTGQLRMWNGNSWFPIGFGRLSAENLRYCGTFSAATGAIAGLTPFGVTEGFKVGDQLPTAADRLAGVYFVATTAGSNTTAAAGITFDNGDWILCNGVTAGWVRVDTLNSGGGSGGSGASSLTDLLDVTITGPVLTGSLLQYNASGQWVNVASLRGDTVPIQLKNSAVRDRVPLPTDLTAGELEVNTNADNPGVFLKDAAGAIRKIAGAGSVPDATDTVKGIVELATVAEAEAGTDAVRAVTPAGAKAAALKYNGAPSATAPTSPAVGQNYTDISQLPPVIKVWDGTQWGPVTSGSTVVDATTSVKGIVQLADAAAVTAGTAGRVVTADQLKATNDAIAGATGGGITDISGTAPITVSGTGSTRTVGVGTATTAAHGVVELATNSETSSGLSTTLAVTPAGVANAISAKANLASPALTGTPTAPTATAGTNTTQLATTAFVAAAVAGVSAPSVADATTSVKGIVLLADASAISAGTSGRVVDAALLKSNYQTLSGMSSYQTTSGMSSYLTTSSASSTYLTQSNASTTYLTQTNASSTYLPRNFSTLTTLP